MRALNPNVDQCWRRSGVISNPALTHPTGTNDILFGGASMDAASRKGCVDGSFQGSVRRQGDTYADIGNTYAATVNTSLRRVRKEGVRLCESAHMRACGNISSECMLLRSQLNIDTECAEYTSVMDSRPKLQVAWLEVVCLLRSPLGKLVRKSL
jgi:hypothetical protein